MLPPSVQCGGLQRLVCDPPVALPVSLRPPCSSDLSVPPSPTYTGDLVLLPGTQHGGLQQLVRDLLPCIPQVTWCCRPVCSAAACSGCLWTSSSGSAAAAPSPSCTTTRWTTSTASWMDINSSSLSMWCVTLCVPT